MTDDSNGDVITTEPRALDEEFPEGTVRPVLDDTASDGSLQYPRDVATDPDSISGLLLEVTRQVVDSPDRDAVERSVCERLVDSSHYRCAWVGDYVPASDGITVQCTAGLDERSLDTVPLGTDGDRSAGRSACELALDTGTVQVLDGVDPEAEPWWASTGVTAIESAAAVPLSHDGTVYGVLAVATSRPDAFDEFERHALGVVGGVVGSTFTAFRHRELLFTDGIVELEVQITDPASLLVRLSDERDCRISVEEHVSAGDRWLLFCDVEGTDAGAVATAAGQHPDVEDCRIIQNREGRRRLELTVGGSSICQTGAAGARVRSAVADHGVCRAVVEVPRSAGVREVVARFRTTYPGLDLLSIREHDRPPAAPDVSGGILDDLTDRQRTVLEAAYRAGYFDWPRESTAEEVASMVDISGPTFLGHIRKAEKLLLADLFD